MKKLIIIFLFLSTEFGFSQSGKYVMWEFYNPYDGRNYTSQFSNLNLKENNTFVLNLFYWKEETEECKKITGKWKIENETLSLIEDKVIRYYLIKNNAIVAQKPEGEKLDYYFENLINLNFLLKSNDGSIEEHTKQSWLKQSKKSCH